MGKKVYKAKYSGKVYNTAHEAAVDNANYLRAKSLTEQTNRIPATYIGGNTQQARNAYWQQEPVLQHAVDSIADRYGIDSAGLKYRLNNEGYIDQQIRLRNNPDLFVSERGYALLNGDNGAGGAQHFGLDDVATLIEQGKVKPINEQWWDINFTNEKGRQTHGAQGSTVADNIGLVAATLKYFRNKAKEDFPNASEADLDRYAQAYYNRGEAGGKKWVESGAKGYNYKAYGGSKDSPWNSLSMADKAVMMEVAIRNGITTLPEIREAYNEFAEGGNLYPDGGYVRSTNDHPVAFDSEGNLVDQVTGETGTMRFPEIILTADPDDVARGRAQRWYKDFGTESNDATSFADGRRQNSHLDERGAEGATKTAGWAKDHPVLNTIGLGLSAAPFAVAAYPAAVGGGELLGTALANPYVDTGLTSVFAAHGLNHAINEGITDWKDGVMTALEVAPLGRLVRPLYNAGKEGLQYMAKATENASPHTGIDYSDIKGGTDHTSLFEKMMYQNKINGFPSLSFSGKNDIGDAVFSPDVVKGISENAKRNLTHNTVGRNVREFERAGYDNAMNNAYKEKAQQLFDDVNIGRYSGRDYAKAGEIDAGGFFNQERNFISINRDSKFPETYIEEHEGRHLLDYNTDMLDSQHKVLSSAYDNDFINIPNTKYAGDLEGYKFMDKEKVTTNRDARDVLFDKFGKHFKFADYGVQDKFIDKLSDDKIFEAVEAANGYGRRYIQFLRDNGKLTPEKAQQFREAMKHVGAAAVPIGLSYMSFGNENAYGGNLYPYGGTKKQAFLTSLDKSLKEDNRFDNAQWRQFFTDLANMESGYSPNITNSIGAKGYFQLMPFNRAKAWKNPTQQFHEMYKLTGNNLNYLNKNLTKEDWKRADALGIDMYGMLAGAHLGGAGNVLKALRGKGNAKDMNGTSVMKYMTKFSQKGSVPTLATPTYYEDTPTALFTPSNPEVFFGGYKAPEIEAPLPSVELDDAPQYSEEEIARQERRERLNNLSMLMSLTSPQGSSNSMLDALGLLMR